MKKRSEIAQLLLQELQGREWEMLEFLQELVRMESPSHRIDQQDDILDFYEGRLRGIGFFTLRVPGQKTGGYLYARPRKRDKQKPVQLLLGHCDTVWPSGSLENMPLSFENGRIKGPGIYDMKAGLTQVFFALAALRSLSLSLSVTPTVLINSDEEIGSRDSTPAIRRLSRLAERVLVMEPPLGLEGKLKTARKGIGRFTLTVTGKAAHAGLDPQKGVSAIVELSYQVQQLYAMNDYAKGITVNVGMIQGGISPNTIAPESSAIIDVRVLTPEDGEMITQKIKALKPHLPEVQLAIDGGIGRPPMVRTPANQRLWQLAKAQGDQLGLELEQATAGGGSDANTSSLFTATLDGLGTPGDGAHAAHEFIVKEKLVERTALLALLVQAGSLKTKP